MYGCYGLPTSFTANPSPLGPTRTTIARRRGLIRSAPKCSVQCSSCLARFFYLPTAVPSKRRAFCSKREQHDCLFAHPDRLYNELIHRLLLRVHKITNLRGGCAHAIHLALFEPPTEDGWLLLLGTYYCVPGNPPARLATGDGVDMGQKLPLSRLLA